MPMITRRLKLFKLLLSLLQVIKNSNCPRIVSLYKIYVSIFLFSLLQRSVSRSDSWETLFNNTFLFTCLMTEPVLSSVVPTKGNMCGSLLPQSGNNCGLWIVGLCYAQ